MSVKFHGESVLNLQIALYDKRRVLSLLISSRAAVQFLFPWDINLFIYLYVVVWWCLWLKIPSYCFFE